MPRRRLHCLRTLQVLPEASRSFEMPSRTLFHAFAPFCRFQGDPDEVGRYHLFNQALKWLVVGWLALFFTIVGLRDSEEWHLRSSSLLTPPHQVLSFSQARCFIGRLLRCIDGVPKAADLPEEMALEKMPGWREELS